MKRIQNQTASTASRRAHRLALTLVSLSTLCALPAAAADYNIGISSEPYPPYYSPDASGEWSGWEIDFADELCRRLGSECETVPLAWEGIIPALKTGKIDMIIGSMAITPQRQEQIAFSDKYKHSPTGLLALKQSEVEPSADSLEGAYLGVQSGSIQENYARAYYAESANLQVYQTLDEELQDLDAGRLDAVLGDIVAMQAFMTSERGQACCEFRGTVAPDQSILGYGVGVGMRKSDQDLKEAVNVAIADIRADGTFERLSAPYFDFDIYGD
ncbi:transporter substrate-binding domain-containing protein [Salinicola aestuarinus]|uniref:transporter substrate-binding domain-containing protein n=1 Tax=Salinicola aestuarinus TaxID=1949082 RepID=UPI000DA1C9CC|nr:transporter substrate-binding domain-containing protein [Salinicola aestuarinus]